MHVTHDLGNGYVGQGIVRAALERGVDVLSISRSGKAAGFTLPTNPQVSLSCCIFARKVADDVIHYC